MSPDPAIHIELTGARHTSERLNTFWRDNAEWAQDLPGDRPTYAIPRAAFEGTALQRVYGETLAIEREFSRLCEECGIIGVWGRQVIGYHLLTRLPLQVDPRLVASLGWTRQQIAAVTGSGDRLDVANDRLLGVVGWLLTEPTFLMNVSHLRAGYEALPASGRPNFPLGRVVTLDTTNARRTNLSAGTSAFAENLRTFLDRWGLTQLVTWELPNPQGPLLPNSLPEGPACPTHGIHLYLPLHYPLQGDDDLLRQVREFQRQQAISLQLPQELGGIAHHAQYAQMFRLIHLERAVRGRFQNGLPHGGVSAVEASAANYLDISLESVRRLRTWILACQRGDRHTIRRLRG